MERDFMGLNSVLKKEEGLDWCKQPDGFERFNNHQEGHIQNTRFLQLHHESKQAVPMNSSFFRPQFSGAPINRHLLKGIPVNSHMVLPSTEPWYSSKVASASTPAPAQLTVFYGGMVNVYDGISLQQAQAIMFMAGNGTFVSTANAPHQRAQTQGPTPIRTQPCSPVSSPMSVSSHPVGQLTTNTNEAIKRVMISLGPTMQSAIPQARKASLARFLEKRKERVIASAPYSVNKNTINYTADNDAFVVAR